MKTISRYIMTLALLLTAVTGAWAQGPWTSGDCTVTLNNGTLTVSGNGAMDDYPNLDQPWENNKGDITSVVVESGVTTVGALSFCNFGKITSVTLPEGLTSIGTRSFLSCSKLTSITIPSTVTSIDAEAFYSCTSVTDVNLYADPANLTWNEDGCDDFNRNPKGSTKCHVLAEYLTAYQTKFNGQVNVTFVGDLKPLATSGEVTTNAASEQDLFTEAWFNMPTFDATVNYMLVRDMQDETNPVIFSGLPSSDNIIVKKGSDGKYQPAEALTIQLIDPLAAAEDAKNIIGADGITITIEQKGEGETWIAVNSTFDAFLANMQPGTYRLTATATDDSPYDGTVYSSQFTAVEKYILVVAPANDFSKNGLESVTVGTKTLTPNANGKVKDNEVDPNTEIKLKAKRGYIIEKVESGDYTPAEGHALSESVVGEIIATDGKAYAVADKDDLPAGVTAAAMVAYKNGTSGLAIALTGTNDNKKWEEACQVVAQKPGVAGHTWRLPTMNEWKQMFSANGGSDSKYESLSAAIKNAGGKGFESFSYDIWTSTEGSIGAYTIILYNSSVMYNEAPKKAKYGFRACFSF